MSNSKTAISWTQATWNPTVGCSLMSAGCTNCYAMRMAARIEMMGGKAARTYSGLTKTVNGNAVWSGVVRLDPAALLKPLKWRKPRLIFVNSMSDLFHPALSSADIDQVVAVMALCDQHVFQALTKRPDRMRDYLNDPATRSRVELRAEMIRPGFRVRSWPLENLWCGTSIENQAVANERLPILLSVQAAVRFLSIEPLLGPVSLIRDVGLDAAARIDWVIVGGESGPGARPMHPDWARDLRDECQQARIPFFFKQSGQFSPQRPAQKRPAIGLMMDGRQVAPGMPGSVTLWSVGKKDDDELDGRLWRDMPRGWAPPRPKVRKRRRSSRRPAAKPSPQLDLR